MDREKKERSPCPGVTAEVENRFLRGAFSKVCHSSNGSSLEHTQSVSRRTKNFREQSQILPGKNEEFWRAILTMPRVDEEIGKSTFEVLQNRRILVKIPLSVRI